MPRLIADPSLGYDAILVSEFRDEDASGELRYRSPRERGTLESISKTGGTNTVTSQYMYDANFGRTATVQFYQGVRNLEFDTTRVPSNTSGNGVNSPSSQACFLQNCKFTMTPGSNHIGVQMYGPGDTGGSGILLGDLSFYGGSTVNQIIVLPCVIGIDELLGHPVE